MEESYKNINSGVEADENHKTKYLQSIKDKQLQSALFRRETITSKQVSNYCRFLLYMDIKCPYVRKLNNIKLSAINYAKGVYTYFKVFNGIMQRNISINFTIRNNYGEKSGSELLKLQIILKAYIKSSILPEINFDNDFDPNNPNFNEEPPSDLELSVYYALHDLKTFNSNIQNTNPQLLSKTINHLISNSYYLKINKSFNNTYHFKLDMLECTIQLPSITNPPGIFTNLNDIINTNIVTDNELQKSFNIDSDPNCFVYMYHLFGNSNDIGTEKIEV